MHPALFAIVGLFALVGLLLYFIIGTFYARRRVWSKFAEAHGLTVDGLEPSGDPKIVGTYRGMPIEVRLLVAGHVRLQGKGSFEVSDTWVTARLPVAFPVPFLLTKKGGAPGQAVPLGIGELDATIDAECGDPNALRGLLADPQVTSVVSTFLNNARYGLVEETGVSASFSAMPKTVEQLQKLVDDCVNCATSIAVAADKAGR